MDPLTEVLRQVSGYIYPNEVELHWSILIVLYPYLTGLVAGAFMLHRLRVASLRAREVELKRAGSDYRGPCPFHGGTHRNFAVIPKKGMFYCFVCHEAGDVFTFFMKRLGMDYPTAVREVARLMGPRLLGVAVVQLNFWVNTWLATQMNAGSVTSLQYGFSLMLMAQAAELFADGRQRRADQATDEQELYEQIGRLKMEVEWLKKSCRGRLRSSGNASIRTTST